MRQSPDVHNPKLARAGHQRQTTNGALMTTPRDRVSHLDLMARLTSAFTDLPDAPSPDLIDHERFTAYVKTPHDVGGEPDTPIKFENKQYEAWEENTYVLCEVLGWRGIWHTEERRRIGNVDVGRTTYLGLPYYGRWVLAAARILVEKHHITLGELTDRLVEVKGRYEGGLEGKPLEARPANQSFRSATRSWCASCPPCSTPAHRNTYAAQQVRSRPSPTRAFHPRTRRGTDMTRSRSGSTSSDSTSPSCGTATPGPTLTPCRPRSLSAGSKPPSSEPGPSPVHQLPLQRKESTMSEHEHEHDHDRTA